MLARVNTAVAPRATRPSFPIALALPALVAIALVAACTYAASQATAPGFDLSAARWFAGHREGWLTPFLEFVSLAFSPGPAIVLAVLVAAVVGYLRRDAWVSAMVLGSTALTMIAVVAVKLGVHRVRPPAFLQLTGETDASYPSGHVAGIAILAAATVYALWPLLSAAWARVLAVAAGVLIVALVAYSRLYLDAHWTTDVVAALALAGVAALLVPATFTRAEPRARELLRARAGVGRGR